MSRSRMAGVFTILMILSIVMGAYSTLVMPTVSGFTQSDLNRPGPFSPPALPELPSNIAGDTTARPDISVRILIGQIFMEYGGAIRIVASNNDTRVLFLQELMFEWVGTLQSSSITVNQRIPAKGTYEIKTMAVPGPAGSGAHDYQLRMRLLQYRNNQWFRMVSGGDEWLSFSEQTIEVMELNASEENPVLYNPGRYYAKVNSRVDFTSEQVGLAAEEAVAGMNPGYDMGKACAVFDWLVTNINYTEDPDGGDAWYSPDETLDMMAGDCEDYAMLLAAMMNHVGGTSRIFLTIDHAFAAVFVGNTSGDLDNATGDIRAHYMTSVPTHYFLDENGYWMIADPLGSFHMGGLAVGQVPTNATGGYWNASFPDSGTLYSIDVTGDYVEQPLWLDPIFWVAFVLVFGVIAIGLSLAAQSEVHAPKTLCFICAGDVGEDLYVCPFCQTTYHRHCAFESAYCRTCGKSIVFPPPPSP